MDPIQVETNNEDETAVFARNNGTKDATPGGGGNGVFGLSTVPNASGVFGSNPKGDGVTGFTESNAKAGVFGRNFTKDNANLSGGGSGVVGVTGAPNGFGVFGGKSNPDNGRGVQGNGNEAGVGGFSDKGNGVFGLSHQREGIHGETISPTFAAVAG